MVTDRSKCYSTCLVGHVEIQRYRLGYIGSGQVKMGWRTGGSSHPLDAEPWNGMSTI